MALQTVSSIEDLQSVVREWKAQGLKVGFVPTMGNLHNGHLSLVEQASEKADKVVVSIFVNPLQFGPNEDFDKYPRTLEQDLTALASKPADLVFLPTSDVLYPNGLEQQTRVIVPELLTGVLEGANRPGHFDGVTTVVYKLFAAVQPDVALFGRKDFQQLKVIEWMQKDLLLPIEIVGAEIVRDVDGLALSSRNQYLSAEQRKIAPKILVTLQNVALSLRSGNKDFALIEQQAVNTLLQEGFDQVDYVSICQSQTLQPAQTSDSDLVILVVARLGATRLLDNMTVSL